MTAQQPFVSVIIPAYNRRHLIGPAIASVIHQTYPHHELIVIDDASADDTADWVAEHYPVEQYPQVTLIRLAKNAGAAGARNVGIEAAKGELIAFLDSDDYWDTDYLATQVQALVDNPQASFVFSNHREILQDGCVKECLYRPSDKYQDLIHRSLADVFIYTMSAVVVRKSALGSCGLLDPRLTICHDRELYIRLLQVGEMAHVEQSLITRVMHDQNISTDYQRWAKYVFMTLDIFFENPNNKAYLPLAPTIRSEWATIIAKRIWQVEKAPVSSALMVGRAIKAAPQRMFKKLIHKMQSRILSAA
ncbi:MAG: glycosyltransferase family A protein [Phormidesmis sp.]